MSLDIYSPFVLRTADPKPAELADKSVVDVTRLGKRIVFQFEDDLYAVLHLMIAGRLQWQPPSPTAKRPLGKVQLLTFRFPVGMLTLVEASSKKRASLHLARSLDAFQRPGADIYTITAGAFAARLRERNRTLKRALTDPATFDGIGNAYADEILFAARLSPVRTTQTLTDEECARLLSSAREVLERWTMRLQDDFPGFPRPNDITAFRPDFAVHGRFGQPCPTCGAPIQRIVYAENEANYCAACQNEGRLLADRSLSRLLKSDWPRTLEELVEGRSTPSR